MIESEIPRWVKVILGESAASSEFEAWCQQRKDDALRVMRKAVVAGDMQKAARAEGQLAFVELFHATVTNAARTEVERAEAAKRRAG